MLPGPEPEDYDPPHVSVADSAAELQTGPAQLETPVGAVAAPADLAQPLADGRNGVEAWIGHQGSVPAVLTAGSTQMGAERPVAGIGRIHGEA